MADFDTTDACSQELPPRCVPGQFLSPVCYQVGAGPVLQGTQRITRLADCTITTVEILDTNDQVVVGAVVVGCPGSDDCCDTGSLCSILQGLPTQVPGGADTALYVTPGGCFLGIPVATVAFPVLAPSGSCAAPSYSFSASPTSGMWFDPAIGPSGAVVISDNNCANRINVGASVSVQSALGSNIELLSGSDVFLDATDDVLLNANVAGNIQLRLGGVAHLEIIPGGEWVVGASVGVAGQVITSNGPGVPPTWQGVAPSFPLLAPDGSCAAPSYSFTNSPDSGMFYNGAAVVIGDDNCDDFIEIGASVNIVSASGDISANAGNDINLTAAADVTTLSGGSIFETPSASFTVAAGSAVTITASGGAAILASASSSVRLDANSQIELRTSGTDHYIVRVDGEWRASGSDGTAGQVFTSNGTGLPATWQAPATSGGAVLIAGAHNVIAAVDTRDVPWGYDDSVDTDTKEMHVPRAGTIRNLYVRHNNAAGNGNSIVYTLAVNGVNTLLTATLATGAVGSASDLVNTVAVAAGDRISFRRAIAVGIATGTIELFASMELV